MPKKVLNTNLVQKYLEHIKNEKKYQNKQLKLMKILVRTYLLIY